MPGDNLNQAEVIFFEPVCLISVDFSYSALPRFAVLDSECE